MILLLHISFLVVIVISVAPVCAGEPCPTRVRVGFPDQNAPPLYRQNGQDFQDRPGLAVELALKAMLQTGCEGNIELVRRPVKRGYVELASEEIDIWAGAAYTEERAEKIAFPTYQGRLDPQMAWMQSTTYLWVRKDDQTIQWNGKILRGPAGFKVGVMRGTMAEKIALDKGWEIEVGPTPDNNLEKLVNGRMPVLLMSMIAEPIPTNEVTEKVKRLEPSVESYGIYNVSSKSFYAKYPEFMTKFWIALCKAARAEPRLLRYGKHPACRG